jgi:NADH dehydrogenase
VSQRPIHAVTGAFGYSGKYIARRLLDQGHRVRTLTNSPHRRSALAERVEVHPFHFLDPEKLKASLKGVSVLYNTYWVRFNYKTFTHADALGRRYASEPVRRRDRTSAYAADLPLDGGGEQ